jgi:hypothetical protein
MMVVIDVQLIEFGTVVIFFGNVHVKSFVVNNRAFQSHRSIPVRLANDSFEDKILLFLSLDGFLENQNR